MTEQPTLPYQMRSLESRSAAASMSDHAPTLRSEVLQTVRIFGPLTDNEIIQKIGGNASSIRPRRVELARMDLIFKCGTIVQANGRSAALWRAA